MGQLSYLDKSKNTYSTVVLLIVFVKEVLVEVNEKLLNGLSKAKY